MSKQKLKLTLLLLFLILGLKQTFAEPDLIIENIDFLGEEVFQGIKVPMRIFILNNGNTPVTTRLPFNHCGQGGWMALTYNQLGGELAGKVFLVHTPEGNTRYEKAVKKQMNYYDPDADEWGTLMAPVITINPRETVEALSEWNFYINGYLGSQLELTLEPEERNVCLVLDPFNEVLEGPGESNNIYSQQFTVQGSITNGPRTKTLDYPKLINEHDYFIFTVGNICTELEGKTICHTAKTEKYVEYSIDGISKTIKIKGLLAWLKSVAYKITNTDQIIPTVEIDGVKLRGYMQGIRVTFE